MHASVMRRLHACIVGLCLTLGVGACDVHGSNGKLDNLILITLDATRFDRLGCYGYRAPTSTAIDALATRSIVYDHAYAHTSWTTPSHASILTGRLPPEHGVRQLWTDRLAPENVTVAEVLEAAGFETAAFVSSVPLRREAGLDQGFSRYDDANFSTRKALAERPADRTTDAVLAWLAQHASGRFFVWIHYFDAHGPYKLHWEYEGPAREAGVVRPDIADVRALESYKYDSEIFFVDLQIGRLLAQIEQLGIAGTTAIVLTADHGEQFGEHGLWGHSGVYESVVRVPLIVYDPRRQGRAERVPSVVGHVDLAPTILHLLGQAPALGDGRVLPPFAPPAEPRSVYFEHAEPKTLAYGLRDGDWKLVTRAWPEGGKPTRAELYDLAQDPQELHDLAASEPARLTAMLERLADARVAPAGAPSLQRTPDASVAERLRSLGYTE